MKELIDKLTSYNIFNYLFPGVLFAGFGSHYTQYAFILDNIVIGVFVYYFYGLVISRIGSLIIEPSLKKIKFVRFVPYPQFVAASKVDEKIEVLSETNNMYRSLISVFVCLLLTKTYSQIEIAYVWISGYAQNIGIVALLVLFVFSYRKQTEYIASRISGTSKKEGSDTAIVE